MTAAASAAKLQVGGLGGPPPPPVSALPVSAALSLRDSLFPKGLCWSFFSPPTSSFRANFDQSKFSFIRLSPRQQKCLARASRCLLFLAGPSDNGGKNTFKVSYNQKY